MTTFEWFLLVVVVIVVPLIIAVVVTLWTIDQANKRKRANRADAQIGVKRKAALSPEEVAERKAARARKQAEEANVASGSPVVLPLVGDHSPETGSSVDADDSVPDADSTPSSLDSGAEGGGDSGGSDGGSSE